MWPDSILRYHFYKKLLDPIEKIRSAEINIRTAYRSLQKNRIYNEQFIIETMRQCDKILKGLDELKKEKL